MSPHHFLLLMLVNGIWGYGLIVGKYGIEHFPPLFFLVLRFALLTLILLPWLRWVPGRMKDVLLIAFVMGALHFAFQFIGFAAADNLSSVAVVNQTHVPLATVLAVLFLGERIGWRRTVALVLSFGGIVLISFDPAVFSQLGAVGLILVGQLLYAIALVLMRRTPTISPFIMQAWTAAVATPVLAALSWLMEDGQIESLRAADLLATGSVLYNVVAVSLIGHTAVFFLVQRYPVSLVTTLFLLTPILAIGFAVWLWDDVLTWKLVAGACLTLTGVAVISLRSGQKAREARGLAVAGRGAGAADDVGPR